MSPVVERYRIVLVFADLEQTETLLPDEPSARTQAAEIRSRRRDVTVRVYHESPGQEPRLLLELQAGGAAAQAPP